MGRLTGKIAVITGGNSGIGLATAKRFVSEGAYVFITGRRQDELDRAIASLGSGVTGVQGDISKLDDLDRLFATVQAEKERIDVLFANAGIGGRNPLGSITEEQFDRLEALEHFAEERGVSLLEVAIGGLLAMPAVTSVIAGATKPEQVRANVEAGAWEPSADDLAALLALR